MQQGLFHIVHLDYPELLEYLAAAVLLFGAGAMAELGVGIRIRAGLWVAGLLALGLFVVRLYTILSSGT